MRAKQAARAIGKGTGFARKFIKGLSLMLLISSISSACILHAAVQYDYPGVKESFQEAKTGMSSTVSSLKQISAEGLVNLLEKADFGSGAINDIADSVRDWANDIADNDQELGEFQKATIIRVVDGDTIVVSIDNENVKVRLIGVDTPESVASQEYLDKTGKQNTAEGKDASAFTKEVLSHYKTVYLEQDKGDTDKYGRNLRYVWLEIPEEVNKETIEEHMLQGILLSNGKAVTMSIKPNVKYAQEFEQIQEDYEEGR